MQTIYKLPKDIKQCTLWIIRGQEYRKQAASHNALETSNEIKRMKIIDEALSNIGNDIPSLEIRKQLHNAIMLNINNRHQYPYSKLELSGISRNSFFQYKAKFIYLVAEKLNMC